MEEKQGALEAAVNGAVPAKAFGGIEEEYSGFKKSKVVILQVPYENDVSYKKGTKSGPQALIDASGNMELYDDELNQETFKIGIHTQPPLDVEKLSPEAMVEKIYAVVGELVKAGKFPVMIGGDHAISTGAVKALKDAYQNLSVLHLDAHYDLRDEYGGTRYSHACSARRISEICPVVQVGQRSLSKEEKEYLATQANGKIKTISVYDILEMPMWKDTVINNLLENVYISIDLDVFDPSLVPAVGTPEPGGIGWYETLDLLKEIAKDRKIIGFDVVELCPIKDMVASDFLAAKLVYRLLGYVFSGKK